MLAQWIQGRLQFIVPVTMTTHTHAILVFEFQKTRKVVCTVQSEDNTVNKTITNCDPAHPGVAKEHEYWVIPTPGIKYFIDVKYADADCSSGTNPDQPTPKPDGFGGASSSGLHSVDQWRYKDGSIVNPTAVCGITIIVIDDIVGPDGSN